MQKQEGRGSTTPPPPIRARINLRIDFTSPLVAVDIIEEFGKNWSPIEYQ